MIRENSLQQLREKDDAFELIVIGGGATGVGVAMDAAVRGLSVLLLEQCDFGKGTSSRSTKLIHGGVRYLQQGDLAMVRDSLRERSRLQTNAPHLVHPLPFLVPCQSLWQRVIMRIGFVLYDWLAGRSEFPRARGVSPAVAEKIASTLQRQRVKWGGVVYYDGQFDDTRLLIHMAMTAAEHDACLLNYAQVVELCHDENGQLNGVVFIDQLSGQQHAIRGRCVINATGPFCDSLRKTDDAEAESIIAPSQGVHIVLPREFFPDETAIIVPKTSDGRVLFLIPWHDHVVIGTTDTPIEQTPLEPQAQDQEIEFLLKTTGEYLKRQPTRADILSVFVGIRPLVRPLSRIDSHDTKSLSRDHTILISASGLITITGGKWTTVRKMAEDCVNRAVQQHGMITNSRTTEQLPLHGASDKATGSVYGTDAVLIEQLIAERPELGRRLHAALPVRAAEVVWAVRHEMAMTVEDVLARRTRLMFLNIEAAREIAAEVAALMADELGQDAAWQKQQLTEFLETSQCYEM